MRSKLFDGLMLKGIEGVISKSSGLIRSGNISVPVSLTFYSERKTGGRYVRIHCVSEIDLKWRDQFKFLDKKERKELGRGIILVPVCEFVSEMRERKKIGFLDELSGGPEDMLRAFTRSAGIKGLKEKELVEFTRLSGEDLQELSQRLEAAGDVMIFSFSPLFLLSHESFEFLCERIISFVKKYHMKNPQETGVSRNLLKSKFEVPDTILLVALEALIKNKKIKYEDENIALVDFKVKLFPEEEIILKEMEFMTIKGELQSVSMEELTKRFRLSSKRINQLLSILIERKKIVQGQDGFILHSSWLEELIQRIRESNKEELSVLEFKQMTGLTRKYAIPLLELLDQIGVTRKVGSKHLIL